MQFVKHMNEMEAPLFICARRMASCRPRRAVALSSRGTRMRSHIKSLGVMDTRQRRLSRSLNSFRIAADAVARHVIRHPPEERFPDRVDRGRRIQLVNATHSLNISAGVWKPSVLRSLSFNCLAIALSCACE